MGIGIKTMGEGNITDYEQVSENIDTEECMKRAHCITTGEGK